MSVSNIPNLAGAILFQDTVSANAAIAVKASSAVLYEMELDNTSNAAASYTKLFNTGTVSVGSTIPDMVVMIPASTKITLVFPSGITFATALTECTTTAGGTAGSTSPSSAVVVKLVYV